MTHPVWSSATTQPSRAGVHSEQILQGFNGILRLDGYTGYERLKRPSPKEELPLFPDLADAAWRRI